MDMVKNGESSTSPRAQDGGAPRGSKFNGQPIEMTKLVMPQLNVFPLRPVHASHDMITLLNLGGLHNTHVRPYAANQDEGQGSDEEGGQTGNKRRRIKIEKGYQHLLPDCIDPVPAGDKSGVALLPLLGDFGNSPGQAPDLPQGPLEMLGMDAFQSARLEPGTQKGYQRGEKAGVKEAEARRRRRREQRTAQSISIGPDGFAISSPALPLDLPTPSSPGIPPLPPSQYSQRPYTPGTPRGRGGGTPRGGMPGRGGYNQHPGKRPYDGAGTGGGAPKRGRGGGYRAGSEAPRGRGRPEVAKGYRSKTDF